MNIIILINIILFDETNLNYINISKSLISSKKREEVFLIIKAFIEVANNTEKLKTFNELVYYFYFASMFLKIFYRKADDNLKYNIRKWIDKITINNFYDNILKI